MALSPKRVVFVVVLLHQYTVIPAVRLLDCSVYCFHGIYDPELRIRNDYTSRYNPCNLSPGGAMMSRSTVVQAGLTGF